MSSGSESDDDYVPGEPEQVSEEESANEEVDTQYEEEIVHNTKKRKLQNITKGKKKLKKKNGTEEIVIKSKEKEECDDSPKLNPEEDKKREDDLWAKFLEGTDTKPKSTSQESNNVVTKSTENKLTLVSNTNINKTQADKEDSKEREKRIFEFAGETIVVENNVIKEKIKATDTPATVSKLEGPSRSRGAGLTNLLGQLNKKNKLSTLEKSKLDWDTYKKEEGIEEEVVNHNKGKAGFLDRRDFLERTDVRQYEIERDLRLNKRSNR